MHEEQGPTDRLAYALDLESFARKICAAYNIGRFRQFSVIETGIEDCNVIVETDKGKFLAKMFAKTRTAQDIQRYVGIMQRVVEAGVHHPQVISTKNGMPIYSDNGVSLALMCFIEGKTFLELDRSPNDGERMAVLEEAAKINQINYHPAYFFDSWAVPNIGAMYERVKRYVERNDLRLIEQVIEQYQEVPVGELPHCFVHGDFTKANVVKADSGRIYILDFSVANWYPRIQEIAVISANLLQDDDGHRPLWETCKMTVDEYSKLNPLTVLEWQHAYSYALAALAMDFMGAHQEKYVEEHGSSEMDYWLNLGRTGLRNAFS
jgi:Ser/Thr protein kinase RdoA (MazF antagonist)